MPHLFAADAEGFSNDLNKATVTECQLGPLQVSDHLAAQIPAQHLYAKKRSDAINAA